MTPATANDLRRLAAEALGTASLLAAIVGSGVVVAQGGDGPAQLFQHAVVVGAALTALILAFGPVSGAHFNPAVTIADAWFGGMHWARAGRYVAAQLVGAILGTAFTNLTFDLPAIAVATTPRPGLAMAAAEGAATAGLLVVVFGLIRSGGGRVVAGAVGVYIAAAIMFTASDAFANPAVTMARMLTDTWAGITPASVPAFLAGQTAGTVAAIALVGWLYHPQPHEAAQMVVPTHTPPSDEGMRTMTPDGLPTVLFLCVHNAGRSQMAAGWLQHLADDRVRVLSGGSEPRAHIHPVAAEAMREVGIDILENTPRAWTRNDLDEADVIVTMGCGDECPVVPGTRYLDWDLPDPAAQPLEHVRPIRDEIKRRVFELLADLDVEPVR